MFPRTLACVALVLTCAASPLAAADETWPQKVTALRSSGPQSFQLRAHIEAGSEKLIADISYSPPDRRCLILRDASDGLPLLIATDGIVLLYDPIGGQILKIRADPEFLAEHTPEDTWRIAWGMRADFPDVASQTTIRLDFGSIFRRYAKSGAGKLALKPTTRTAELTDKDMKVLLTVDENDPPRPTAFSMDGPRLTVRCKSFVYDAPLPKWHREINTIALFKHLPLRAVRDQSLFPPDVQEKMGKVQGLLRGKGLFIIRPVMRDAALRAAFEKNSPIRIDFDEVKTNDENLRERWLKALQEQGFEFPAVDAKEGLK